MKKAKPFEEKACVECQSPYKHYSTTKHPLCNKCRNQFYNRNQRLKPEEYRLHYPLTENEKRKRYNRLRKSLNNCVNRKACIEQIQKNLDEMIELGIWKWCVDSRIPIKSKGYHTRGRRKAVSNEYPNTKDMPY